MRIDIIKAPTAPMRELDSASTARLLNAARQAVDREVEALLDAARREADRLVGDAHIDADRIAARARDAADRQGARRWVEASVAFARVRQASTAAIEREALELAVEIARRIVGDHVSASAEAWADLVARTCERLRRDARLVVRHSADDADRIHVALERLSAFREVAFELDASLAAGDCTAECAGVRVDARLDVQLAAIEQVLLGASQEEDLS